MQVFDIGEPRKLTSSWYDDDGAGIEPSAITLEVVHPDGTVDTWTKAQLTQGTTTADWYRWVTPDAAGIWGYTFTGIVDGMEVTQGAFLLVGEAGNDGQPCEPWCDWEDVAACATPPTLDVAGQELVLDQATEILFNLSGRYYPGLCTATRSLCFTCGSCYPTACDCAPYPAIDLSGRYPVWAATEVVLDGETLAPSAYRVRDRRWLVRVDGEVWPSGSNVTDVAQFRVSWVYGRPVTTGGRLAAAQFALEIAKLCAGDKTCALPQRVQSLTREGVNYVLLDPMTMIQEGRTGLATVDLWLASDKIGRKPRPRIYHPALGSSERVR